MISCTQHIGVGKYAVKSLGYLVKMEKHNRRLFEEIKEKYRGNIKELINSDSSYLDSYRKVIKEHILPAIMDYNEGKRKDRQIKGVEGYIEKLENDKSKNMATEMIVQVADREFWKERKKDRHKMEFVYREYLEFLNKEFPNLKVISCTFHNDEDSPHLHIVGVPVAEFDNGLRMRVSQRNVFNKAEMERWQDLGRDFLQKSMRKWIDKDFSFDEKEKGRNHNYGIDELIQRNEDFKKRNGVKELKEHKELLLESISAMDEMLKEFDFMGINGNKKKEKMKEVERNFERFKGVLNESVKTYSEEFSKLQDSVNEIRLDDKHIEELRKGLTREHKKELGKIIRENYVNSNDYSNFLEKVQEDLRQQMINKLKRQVKQKELIEELEKEREEFIKKRAERVKELEEIDKEIDKKKNTLANMEKEVSGLKDKSLEIEREIEKNKALKSKYDIIVNDYESLDVVKKYKEIELEYYANLESNRILKEDIEKKSKDLELISLENKQIQSKNDELKKSLSKLEGLKRLESYFYARAEEDISDYLVKERGYGKDKARDVAVNVIQANFGLNLVKAMEEYAYTGELDIEALNGFKNDVKGFGYNEEFERHK
jgi:hypothetical protein